MTKSKSEIDKDHYTKKIKDYFKFSKWIKKDEIKLITKQEIEAFCQSKARKELNKK